LNDVLLDLGQLLQESSFTRPGSSDDDASRVLAIAKNLQVASVHEAVLKILVVLLRTFPPDRIVLLEFEHALVQLGHGRFLLLG
jgi:hypothetical protein